jgi:site-specific DNA-methyltransferase (adenine-specific)
MSNFFVAGSAAMTSSRDDWETPRAMFDALNARYGFTLDPASTDENAKCARHYTAADDGLAQDWAGEVVWLNPPYGRNIAAWMRKASAEAARGAQIVALVPARTDTAWFHDYVKPYARVEFLRGRVKFERGGVAGTAAPFPSMLCYYNC